MWGEVLCKVQGPQVGVCQVYLGDSKETNVGNTLGNRGNEGEWLEIKSQRSLDHARPLLDVRWEAIGRLKC